MTTTRRRVVRVIASAWPEDEVDRVLERAAADPRKPIRAEVLAETCEALDRNTAQEMVHLGRVSSKPLSRPPFRGLMLFQSSVIQLIPHWSRNTLPTMAPANVTRVR